MPISELSYVELHRGFGPAQQHQVVASFVEVLRKTLRPRFPVFERIGTQQENERAEMSASV